MIKLFFHLKLMIMLNKKCVSKQNKIVLLGFSVTVKIHSIVKLCHCHRFKFDLKYQKLCCYNF